MHPTSDDTPFDSLTGARQRNVSEASAGRVLLAHTSLNLSGDTAMLAHAEECSGGFEETGCRSWARVPFGLAGLVAVVAGLVALAPASAHADALIVHSAKVASWRAAG